MARVKVQLSDNIKRIVYVDPDATVGATIGKDLRLPSGQVGTLAELQALFGGAASGAPARTTGAHSLLSGLAEGNDHPQYTRKDTLTTAGDLYVRGASTVQRLAIGASLDVLMVVGGAPVWDALAAVAYTGLLVDLADANLATGPGTDGYAVTWDDTNSEFILAPGGGGGGFPEELGYAGIF